MSNPHENPTIRCWTSRWVVVTLVAVTAAGGARGYGVEARAWGGAVAAAVVVTEQHVAVRLARRAAAAPSRTAAIFALTGGAR
jgi:cell division septal protein FtsQ